MGSSAAGQGMVPGSGTPAVGTRKAVAVAADETLAAAGLVALETEA